MKMKKYVLFFIALSSSLWAAIEKNEKINSKSECFDQKKQKMKVPTHTFRDDFFACTKEELATHNHNAPNKQINHASKEEDIKFLFTYFLRDSY